MTDIVLGTTTSKIPVTLQLEELLATRLLVQGNSGSGKSHLLRRLIEQSAQYVQQIIIDPEGDYVQLAERYGHVVIAAQDYSAKGMEEIGARVRQHRYSAVLNLEHMSDIDGQMRQAAAFLRGLFEVERAHWHSVLVFVDEAQIFAPSGTEGSDESRKATLAAMVNLMCRGRKRGLCGIIATQRLAKLAKNVAAECANFLMGRTLLDIDMSRAADLLGMEKKKAEIFRDLTPGRFIGLGSAIARRPIEISIGTVETAGRGGTPTLVPPPPMPEGPVDEILFAAPAPVVAMAERRPAPPPPAIAMASVVSAIAEEMEPAPPPPPAPPSDKPSFDELIARVSAQEASRYLGAADLYQGFLQACRLVGLNGRTYDQATFRRKLAQARAGLLPLPEGDDEWRAVVSTADQFQDEDRAVYLLLAKAARDRETCPPDSTLALILGSQSARRGRAILAHIQSRGAVAVREDLSGRRIVGFPTLGWETEPGDPTL
jgi:hypothetical protein